MLALLLIVMLAWRALSPRISGRRGQRLGISEYHEIDKSRRLVLVRRDNVEHLILIGGGQDLVIEPGITAAGHCGRLYPCPRRTCHVAPEPGTFRAAPRAPVFSERKMAAGRRDEPEL